MKKWLIEKFLPMWAKETVLSDNRQLRRKLRQLEQEKEKMEAYIRGVDTGIRACKQIRVYAGGEK